MPLIDALPVRAAARASKGYGPHDIYLNTGHVVRMDEPDLNGIIERIDARLKQLGLSDREASLRATGKPDAIRELRRHKRPSDMRMRQLAEALDCDVDDLTGQLDWATQAMIDNMSLATRAKTESVSGLPRDVPVYAPLSSNPFRNEGRFEVSFDQPIRQACRPPILTGRDDVFVIAMPDLTMEPRFEFGDELYIDPRAPLTEGDYIFMRFEPLEPATPASKWTVAVKRLRSVEEKGIVVEQFAPPKTELINIHEVWTALRVIPPRELLSY